MNTTLENILTKTFITLLAGSPFVSVHLYADDIEIYTGALEGGYEDQIEPNILYILDTSGSMKKSPGFFIDPKEWHEEPYDPDVTYPGPCNPDHVYRQSVGSDELDDDGNLRVVIVDEDTGRGYPIQDDGDPSFQDCVDDDGDEVEYRFPKVALHCQKAREAFDNPERGWYQDKIIVKRLDDYVKYSWYSPSSDHRDHAGDLRECADDYGYHGHNIDDPYGKTYPVHDDAREYASTAADGDVFHPDDYGNGTELVIADGNFLNWFHAVPQTRMTAVKIAVRDIVRDLPENTRVGLMRFDTGTWSSNTEGGMVFHEFVRVGDGDNRQSLVDAVMDLDDRTEGGTPLGETMMEAVHLFSGGPVYWGNLTHDADGNEMFSVPESRQDPTPGTEGHNYYKSPIEYSCQQNTIVYLTDGAASSDYSADNYYDAHDRSLWETYGLEDPWRDEEDAFWWGGTFRGGFRFLPNADNYLEDEDGDGDIDNCDSEFLNCLPKIANWLAHEDANPDVPGVQTVTTNTIGFMPADADDDEDTLPDPEFLQETASYGSGEFFQVTSFDELKEAFLVTTRKAVSANTAFAAPALAINAFNRTQDGNRIYFALFKTSTEPGWGGNLKAYQIDALPDGSVGIVDATGKPAVDSETGLFHFDARSIWSADEDGDQALEGGAASNHPDWPYDRYVFTLLGDISGPTAIKSSGTRIYTLSDIDENLLGMTGSEPYTKNRLLTWLWGYEPDSWTTPRNHIGDPLHSRPVAVSYGTDESDPDQKIFFGTNDGFLHIIDADTGEEDFAFIAEEFLQNAKRIYEKDASQGKVYGLDGPPVLLVDEGAAYEPGISGDDKVYLYVGMRRGGRSLYAFDMTDYDNPKIQWRIQGGNVDGDGTDNDEFHHLGYTFSAPQKGELKIDGSAKKVLIFGGGYDMKQDDPDGSAGTTDDPYVADDYGNAIYIVDAETGERLWWASNHEDADLVIPEMVNSIPSDVSVIDIDNDGWTDRLYVGDTGGRIFRIDLDEFNSSANISATGGMIADVGGSSHAGSHPDLATVADNRKLFYAPDIVRVENGHDNYLAIAFGTGNRAHPSYPIAGDTAVEDKFFVLKDPYILNKPSNYASAYGFTLGDLYDATDNLVMALDEDGNPDQDAREAAVDAMNAADGWYIDMEHEGEKVLSAAVTLNYKVYFTSFEPQDIDLENCQARTGLGRLYTLDIRNGKPVNPNYYAANPGNGPDTTLETEDRAYELARDGIPPALTFTFPEANNGEPLPLVATETPPADPGVNMQRSYWRTQ